MNNKKIKFVSIILLLSLMLTLFIPFTAYAEEGYALSGTWQFCDDPEMPESSISQSVTYTTLHSDIVYNSMNVNSTSIYMGNDIVGSRPFSNSVWIYENCKIVDFGEVSQTVSEEYFNWFTKAAKKVTVTASNVLSDLERDSSFNASNYPLLTYENFLVLNKDNDTSNDVEMLSVIQISESENKELFIYTYQPLEVTSEICASSITMSVGHNSKAYEKYELALDSSSGSLKKYLVKGYTVSDDTERFYNISEIERPFDPSLDAAISGETITDFKAHAVAQTWCCYYLNGSLVYEMENLDVVEITPTLTDFVYLEDGFSLGDIVNYDRACYSHYIAFNVDNYSVDKIIDASITYKIIDTKYTETIYYTAGIESSRKSATQYKSSGGEWVTSPLSSDWRTVNLKITDQQSMNYQGGGLLAKKYSWDRIMTASNFVDTFEDQGGRWNEGTKQTLSNSQFVFAFTENAVTEIGPTPTYSADGMWKLSDFFAREATEVAQVDILRLHFMSEGKSYDLGVVADTVTPDDIPGGVAGGVEDPEQFLEDILQIVFFFILVVIILVLIPYIKPLISTIATGIKEMLSLVWSAVTLPFQLIASAFKTKRK